MDKLIYGMIYLGSALMVYNVYSYIRYAGHLQEKKDWGKERKVLYIPIILLVMFLLGYLAVGIFGQPDLIVSGILFGGSIFVFIIFQLLQFITNRVQENERLEAQLIAAEERSQTKNIIMSSLSHEMRTPMNAIIGLDFIALQSDKLHPETRRQIEKIDENARHLMALIENILDMSDIDAGTMVLKEDTFSVYELIEMINRMMRSRCTMKGLDYQNAINGSLDDFYVGDQRKLRQILVSILDNAIKFTDSPGVVTFVTKQVSNVGSSRTLRFTISDTGEGISEEYLPRIFEPFDKEDNSMTSRHGGIGLSLAVTKKIVELMHGDIEISSQKNVGSTFTVTVMLDASDRKAAPKKPTEKPEAGKQEQIPSVFTRTEPELAAGESEETSGESEDAADESAEPAQMRVLIAEDIDINAEILADLLDMEDIASERAENGEIAVRMFSQNKENYYQAILMDLRMPVMDGLEAARKIRALDRPDAAAIPIIAITANTSDNDKSNVIEAGMNCHLSKPVDAELLFETLERLVSHEHETDEKTVSGKESL